MQKRIPTRFESFRSLLETQAASLSEHPAIIHAEAEAPCSYAKLLDFAQQSASRWKAGGKSCLGLLCDGSFACVCEIFGAVMAGLQVVLFDENIPEEQLRVLICKTDVDVFWDHGLLEEDLSLELTDGVRDGAGRLLFFTSGTTDSAKAVVLTEASLCASAWNGASLLPLRPEDRLLCALPLNHVFGFVCGLLWGLSCGATVALGRGARSYARDFLFFRPTAVSLVPLLVGYLLKQNALNPELKLVLIGAGDCPPALPAALKRQDIRVSFGYGLTETSSGVALSLGEDPYAMQVCPDDRITIAEDGEILIENTSCMMQGYYKDSAGTEAVLKNGVLSTGDLGRFDERGLLHVTGRKKEILVFPDGTKLYLPEYEARLQAVLHDREFCVISVASAPALVLRGKESEREAVQAALEPLMRELPLPRRIKSVYFEPAPLPRTATGKLQRWVLQKKVVTEHDKK